MNFSDHLKQKPIFELLHKCAIETGSPTYLVGGYVRDLILGRSSKDIDVVCVGSGIELAELFLEKIGGKGHLSVFKNFGTAMVKFDLEEVEFVGARKESYNRESRKPVVEDGTLQDDQNRRDFTINALAISLNKADYGELVDPFGGVEDMKKKIIRTPLDPDITFSDDPLRMMRACRFASQLNFDIHPDTFDALLRNKDRIKIISQERIIEELNKIILSPKPSYGFKLLHFCGILPIIFPEFVALQGAETQEGKGHKDNFYHTLQVLDNVADFSNDLWLRWAAIMHDIAKPLTKRFEKGHGWTFHGHEEKGARMTPGIFRKMKLPMGDNMNFVQKLVRLHLRPIALVKEEVTDSAIRRLLFEAGEDIDALMTLCRCDITSKNNDKVKRYLTNFDKVQQKLIEVESRDKLRNFQPVITGELIMKTLNLQPGKLVGDIKTGVREAILEGEIPNEYEAGYKKMMELAEKFGIKKI
jgi:tRNA nucleotidyltransferase/poly(A) polymerase